jgi:hypothetical protein
MHFAARIAFLIALLATIPSWSQSTTPRVQPPAKVGPDTTSELQLLTRQVEALHRDQLNYLQGLPFRSTA